MEHKKLELILLIIWLIVYPIVDHIDDLIYSYRRTVIEKKEPSTDEVHGLSQLMGFVIYIAVAGFLIYLIFQK
jgi:hypothetical protein